MKSKNDSATPYKPGSVTALCNSNPTSDKGHSQLLSAMQKMMDTPASPSGLGSGSPKSGPLPGNFGPNPGPI